MQTKCKRCMYSRAMNQPKPRLCVICKHPEGVPYESLQEKVLKKVKKFYLKGATIRNQKNCIKVNAFVLVDKDLEFFKSIEGMYTDILIKRSGLGLVVILNF
jgi:hypothetical protein